jgi:UDP-N-acetylmuramyl pentapeptide phosphotransferase/UDP-N-acetylglucosamine-1-phosphate transferase
MTTELLNNPYVFIPGAIILSFLVAYRSIPTIVHVALDKKLFDVPNGRSSHTKVTPSLGGIALFSSFFIAYLIFCNGNKMEGVPAILSAMVVIFFLGMKDDIQVLDAKKKLAGQIIAAILVIVIGDIRLTSFHGFMTINEIPYFVSFIFTLFIIIVVTNAINLIDGIDGLASGTAIIGLSGFGIWFLLAGFYPEALLSLTMTGALAAFFRFNVYSDKNKLFMGDTGSLLLGFLLAIVAIRFNEVNIKQDFAYAINAAPAVSIGILIVPLFDTLRVFVTRIMSGRSPFSPDKRHLHHRLLAITGSHRGATYRILGINLLFVLLSFSMNGLSLHYKILILFIAATIVSYIPVAMMKKRQIEVH